MNQRKPHTKQPSSLADETAPRRKSEYAVAVIAALSLIAIIQWVSINSKSSEEDAPVAFDYKAAAAERSAPSALLVAMKQKLSAQFPEVTTEAVSEDLLIRASDAVAEQNDEKFAESMTMLGINALKEDDIDSAGVYLAEALAAYEYIDDELGIANVELLRGEINIQKRADARRAAYAYDAMQLARWKVSHGQFHDAIEELEYAVEENLALKRYGAAAAVYQTLYKGYTEHGQAYQAQQAGIEIVKLHASSGRSLMANEMMQILQANGLDTASVEQLKQDNLKLQMEYEDSVGQIGQARDYQQLYNHFIHAGDPVRAWQFRLKAQASLRGASKRAMHRSQTGVLAMLYTSNDHMENAQRSLERAQTLFTNNDQPELIEASQRLQERVY